MIIVIVLAQTGLLPDIYKSSNVAFYSVAMDFLFIKSIKSFLMSSKNSSSQFLGMRTLYKFDNYFVKQICKVTFKMVLHDLIYSK